MKFKDLKEGELFAFEGSTYMKFKGVNKSNCFMITGWLDNNRPQDVQQDSEVKKVANNLNEFQKEIK